MKPYIKTHGPDVRILVDGEQFYTFVRFLKRGFTATEVGEVVMTVKDGILTIESSVGKVTLNCDGGSAVTARIRPTNFTGLAKLGKGTTGPLLIAFRPVLGEVGFPYHGTRAKFP